MNCSSTPENKADKSPNAGSAIGYFREDFGNSKADPKAKRDAIYRFAAEKNLSINSIRFDSFDMFSGRINEQIGLLRAMAEVGAGHYDVLILPSMCDLSRTPIIVAEFFRAARDMNVRVLVVDSDFDSYNLEHQATSDLFFRLLATIQ